MWAEYLKRRCEAAWMENSGGETIGVKANFVVA
jgi:hypothetical protein